MLEFHIRTGLAVGATVKVAEAYSSGHSGEEEMSQDRFGDVTVVVDDDFVATVEMHRPPENFFSLDVIDALGDAYDALDAEANCRAIVLCAEGKHFCAGADLSGDSNGATNAGTPGPDLLYRKAARLFGNETPVVAAIQGAAVGAGFGLACSADFRIACPEARFSANFAQFGFHHIFGLSVTLPAIVGQQHALDLLYTGRRLKGEDAVRIGLCDRLVANDVVRAGGTHPRGGDRRVRPIGRPVDPSDDAHRSRRSHSPRDRARGHRTGMVAIDLRLARRRACGQRAPATEVRGPMSAGTAALTSG